MSPETSKPRFRVAAAFLIPLAIAAVLASVHFARTWRQRNSPLAQALAAYDRGDFDKAAAIADAEIRATPGDLRPLRIWARARARANHTDAIAAFLKLAAFNTFASEDAFRLANLLIHEGQFAHGWTLIECSDYYATNLEAQAELERLRSAGAATPSDLSAIETLSSVADPALRRGLVLGLLEVDAALGNPPRSIQADGVLDRLLLGGRQPLIAIVNEAELDKALARLLLEFGQRAAARSKLERVIKTAPDDEASWLLSRVALQEGKHDEATAALEAAEGFGTSHRDRPEPSAYVGARACAECHRRLTKNQQASRHATTLYKGAELNNLPRPTGALKDPANPDVTHTIEPADGGVNLSATVGSETVRAFMNFALGSGHRGVTMVGTDADSHYREARMSYYATAHTWDITKGFEKHPPHAADYLGKDLGFTGFRNCIHCHATRFRSLSDHSGPEAADRGIGCERCHGPGKNHVLAEQSGFAESAIAHPKTATPKQRMALCATCHGADGSIPESDPEFVRFQSTTLTFSKCFTKSAGAIECLTCHDPHANLETRAAFYESKCLSCHATTGAASANSAKTCSVNPVSKCLDCHMPKVENAVPYTTFTDHHIRIHRARTEPK